MDVFAEVHARLERRGDLVAAALFGSRRPGGRPRADSDLDLAVLPLSDGPDTRRHLQADLAAELSDLAPGGRVDIVLLDESPELLRQRVFETAVPLFGADSAAWKSLRVQTMREHGDREHYRAILRRGLKRRLLAEGDSTPAVLSTDG